MVAALSDNSIPPNNVGWDARQIPGFCSEDNRGIHVAIEYLLFLDLLVFRESFQKKL